METTPNTDRKCEGSRLDDTGQLRCGGCDKPARNPNRLMAHQARRAEQAERSA